MEDEAFLGSRQPEESSMVPDVQTCGPKRSSGKYGLTMPRATLDERFISSNLRLTGI